MSQVEDSRSERETNDSQPDSKKRKRNRQALNCSVCRARKVQCDRRRPACTSCIKRGTASECKWEDKGVEPAAQTYALETVVQSIRAHFEERLAQVERRLDIPITANSEQVARQALFATFNTGVPPPSAVGGSNLIWQDSDDGTQEEKELDEHDEANGAALALEVLAGGDFAKTTADTSITHASVEKLPIKEFVYKSILRKDFVDIGPRSGSPPIPGQATRREIVNAVIAYLGNESKASKLLDYFVGTVAFVAGASWTKLIQYEHDAFWYLVRKGEKDYDPAWIADYCGTLAIAAAAQADGSSDDLLAEHLYQLSKSALEVCDWRRKPSFRVISCLSRHHMWMNFQNEWPAASICLVEAVKAAQSLGYHQLGDDPSVAISDIALPPDSLLSRELPVQMCWDLVSQDWLGMPLGRESVVPPETVTTAMPRNYTDEHLEFGDLKTQPQAAHIFTESFMCWGKAQAARYTRDHLDLGKPPSGGAELDQYYSRLCALEDDFMARIRPGIASMTQLGEDDWRCMLMRSGIGMKTLHVHREFMTRAYRDPEKFGRSASACVEGARTALAMVRRMAEVRAPTSAIWFLSRQSLAAITTIYIDIFRDADIGIDPAISDTKLSDIPYSVKLFKTLEANSAPSVKELGRKGQLLVAALDAAKEARRGRITGQRSSGGYGKLFRRIAADVEKCSASNPPSCGSDISPHGSNGNFSHIIEETKPSTSNTATPTIGWLDDAETRNLLSSLGLINDEGEWRTSFAMNPALEPAPAPTTNTMAMSNGLLHSHYTSAPYGQTIQAQSQMHAQQQQQYSQQSAQPAATWPPTNYLDAIDRSFTALNAYSQYSL